MSRHETANTWKEYDLEQNKKVKKRHVVEHDMRHEEVERQAD